MSARTDILKRSPLFEGLPGDHLEQIAEIAVERSFGKEAFVFGEGDLADGFYIVAEGLIKIFKVSPDGKEQILHIFGPGEPFGEVAVFTGRSFPASAQPLRKSRLLFFPRRAFVDLISTNPSLSLNMLAVLATRLRQFTLQVESLSLKEIPARLATYLTYLSEEQKNESAVTLTISKGHLASLLGTIPETLSRIFLKMTEQNLIEVRGRRIRLLDRTALKALAAHGKD